MVIPRGARTIRDEGGAVDDGRPKPVDVGVDVGVGMLID
jgi:hypothetical protein